jgi:hypothetical protein
MGGHVTEPADGRPAPARARPRRAQRFILPDVHHDERTTERIVAFLDGPAATGNRRSTARARQDRPRLPRELDTRPDWTAALQLEAARHARYGRPATVILLELAGPAGARSLDRDARALADVIRAEARETDRAVRLGAASFRVLLPETNARAARHAATRIGRAFQDVAARRSGSPELCIEIAAPTRGGSLEEALTDAERRLAD